MSDMYCGRCFAPGAAELASGLAAGARAQCRLCHKSGDCWNISAWAEVFAPLLDLFERAPHGGDSLVNHLESDWMVFSDRTSTGREHFVAALVAAAGPSRPGNGLLCLKKEAIAKDRWDAFCEAIAKKRRWHGPRSREILEELELATNLRRERLWPKSRPLYRARVCESTASPFTYKEMGPPRAALATPGRANVAGIPVLYAAESIKTAVYECRPTRGSTVAIAEFKARSAPLRLLDLTSRATRLQNPFEEGGGTQLAEMRRAVDLGALIGEAFSRPVRSGDDVHDYVATQFVAEYIAEQLLDGVMYDSSFADPTDRSMANVVIFDPSRVTVVRKRPKHVYVNGVEWRMEDLDV